MYVMFPYMSHEKTPINVGINISYVDPSWDFFFVEPRCPESLDRSAFALEDCRLRVGWGHPKFPDGCKVKGLTTLEDHPS